MDGEQCRLHANKYKGVLRLCKICCLGYTFFMEPQLSANIPVSTPEQAGGQKIVIIEDNASLAEIYKTRLELLGYTCYIGYNGITGLYFAQQEMPDLVLLDLMIPDISGEEVLKTMRASDWGKDMKVLVISNLNESSVPTNLRELGIEDYIVKANLSEDEIDRIVNGILRPEPQADLPAPAAA